MLVRLLYASRAVDTSATAIDAIVGHAKLRNASRGVTGILCYGSGIYMQAIEGDRTEINTLYNNLVGDVRHTDLTMLAFEEIDERRYDKWTMGQVNLTQTHNTTLLRYSRLPVLDPFMLSGKVAFALVDELVATAWS